MKKRILASILAVLMVVLLVPAVLISSTFAASPSGTLPDIIPGDYVNSMIVEDFEGTSVDPAFADFATDGFAVYDDGGNNVFKGNVQTGGNSQWINQEVSDFGIIFNAKIKNIQTQWQGFNIYLRGKKDTAWSDGYRIAVNTLGDTKKVELYARTTNGNPQSVTVSTVTMDAALSSDKWYTFLVAIEGQKLSFFIYDIEADNLIEIFDEVEIDQNTWDSGYVGFCRDNVAEVLFDDIALVEPLQLPDVMFNLGSDFANRKLCLYPEMTEVTTDANGKATFTGAYAGDHTLSVYNEDETEEEYMSLLFLAKSDTFEAGGNGVNMTSAGATITMQLVSDELVITQGVSGIQTSSSSAASSTATSSTAASSATSSIGATGLSNITMGKTQNSLLSENFDGANVNAAFNDMLTAGCTVANGKLTNTGVTKDQYGNKDRVYTTSATSFSDYIFETDVTVSADYSAGWRFPTYLFRTSTRTSTNGALEGNFYSLSIGTYTPADGMQVWVSKRKDGANSYLVGTSSTTGVALPAAAGVTMTTRSYHLKVIINGTSFKAYIGDTLIADATLDGEYASGGFGYTSTNFDVSLDNINIYNPLTLSGATFDLGADYANRKVELHSIVKTGTTNAQGLVTFSNIEAGTHQLKVYNAAGTGVDYTVDLFLAEGTALEAGGNGVNMTTAGATIVLRLVNGQLVITSASSGLGSAVITSQGSTATGDTTNVWMLIAIMALAAGAVFAVKKIKV